MELTKKRTIKLHREHWRWCKRTGKDKKDWPEWENYPNILYNCFLCEYTQENCDKCPLEWNTESCLDVGSYYRRWLEAKTPRTRKKYAKLIAELPEKK